MIEMIAFKDSSFLSIYYSNWLKSDADIEKIIELFRIQYERLRSKEQPFSIPISNK